MNEEKKKKKKTFKLDQNTAKAYVDDQLSIKLYTHMHIHFHSL